MNLTPVGSIPVPSIRMRVAVSGTRFTQTVTFNEVRAAVAWTLPPTVLLSRRGTPVVGS